MPLPLKTRVFIDAVKYLVFADVFERPSRLRLSKT